MPGSETVKGHQTLIKRQRKSCPAELVFLRRFRTKVRNGCVFDVRSTIFVHENKLIISPCYTKSMINLQKALQTFKRQNRVNNSYIAEYCDVSLPTVSRGVSGKIQNAAPATLEKLLEMMGLDSEEAQTVHGLSPEKPMIGCMEPGTGLLDEINREGYIQVTQEDAKGGDLFMKMKGDSMKDENICDGALLYVKQCHEVSDHVPAVLRVHNELTVRRLLRKDGFWILQAANSEVEPVVYTQADIEELPVELVGKVVYVRQDFE